jgi:hypothetical protein
MTGASVKKGTSGMRFCWTCVVAVLALFALGCDDANRVNVRGTVTFSDDGSPLKRGVVCFDNEKLMGRGTLKPDGSYAIGVEKDGRGIPPGSYKVSILFAEEELPGGAIYAPRTKQLIDEKYASRSTSGIEIVVDPATTRFDMKVDRPAAK